MVCPKMWVDGHPVNSGADKTGSSALKVFAKERLQKDVRRSMMVRPWSRVHYLSLETLGN